MSKKARLISIISVIFVAGAGLYLVGCDADTTGPTDPGVNYLPQTFSLAVADGSASNDGFDHNGVAVITLDWNNPSPGANVVAPKYTYEYADQPYPLVDGGLVRDAATWAQAPETVLTLNNVYGNGGVTTVRVKSVYTFVNPPRIWFLLQWEDDALRQENSGYLGNHWEYVSKEGSAAERWDPQWNDNEDWVAFMWDTWRKVPPDEGVRDFYFAPMTNGFQNNGCTVTCHSDDANHPHHTNNADDVCDLWIWTGTRTNYTANLTNWASGANDPAFMFDCYIDQTGFGWGTNDSFLDADDELVEWLVFDEGGAPYLINFRPAVGYPYYGAFGDPGANERYLWLSTEGVREITIIGDGVISPTDERWEIGDMVAGYVHRAALGSAADVLGRGAWVEANGVGTWTLEIRRNIGATYDEINNDEDVFLGIFEAHPDE